MPKSSSEAGQWVADNAGSWAKPKPAPKGRKAKTASSQQAREKRAQAKGEYRSRAKSTKVRFGTIKNFVESHRDFSGSECVFVPAALDGAVAQVSFCGKNISASRYMCLLTNGAPKHDGAMARHKCGNGHLSCINPSHLIWGDASDNASDAAKHRRAGLDVQDRVNSIG